MFYIAQNIWKCNIQHCAKTQQTVKLHKLEKLSIKLKKADLDITFLSNCKVFNVITKFLAFNLPYTNDTDSRFIRKRLLWSALKKRKDEQYNWRKNYGRSIEVKKY